MIKSINKIQSVSSDIILKIIRARLRNERFKLYDARGRLKRSMDGRAIDYWSFGLYEKLFELFGELPQHSESIFYSLKKEKPRILVTESTESPETQFMVSPDGDIYRSDKLLDAVTAYAFSAAESFSCFSDIKSLTERFLSKSNFSYAGTLYDAAVEKSSIGFETFSEYLENEMCTKCGAMADYREKRTAIFVRCQDDDDDDIDVEKEKDIITICSVPTVHGIDVDMEIIIGVELAGCHKSEREEYYKELAKICRTCGIEAHRSSDPIPISLKISRSQIFEGDILRSIKE